MESLALDAATSITNVVAGRVCQEIGLAWGFKDQLNMLKERLLDTQALMNDLANAEHAEKSQLVSRWIQKLKAVAYSAEELMDDYTYEMLRRKHQGWDIIEGCRNFLRPSSNRIVFRTWMAHRIKQILSELNQLHTDHDIFGLQQLARKAVSASTYAGLNEYALDESRRSPTTSGIIGRERDVKDLLEILLNPEGNSPDLPVIAIVGLGGLGKTTLARLLYEHAKVEGHFNGKKPWICVSEDFHVEKILKEMVESLTSNKCDLTNIGAIIENLQKELKGKRFFLVLDDVWNDNKDLWKSFKTELQRIGGLTGSVILITTRRHGVAKACAAITHELKGLSEEDGWDLLKEQVFDEKTPYDSSFDDVGKRILVEKCKGVPLAIKSIGSLLKSKQHESGWCLHRLRELRHIETSRPVSASRGLQKLTSLQTLPRLGLRNGKGWTIDELGPLNQVKGDVYISGLDRVKNKEEATKAEIGRKDKILRLVLCWDGRGEGNNDEDVLGGLEPHPNIQSLKIRGFKGVSLPEWIMTMSVNHTKHATQLKPSHRGEFRKLQGVQKASLPWATTESDNLEARRV